MSQQSGEQPRIEVRASVDEEYLRFITAHSFRTSQQ
jgi:hypothetical protein